MSTDHSLLNSMSNKNRNRNGGIQPTQRTQGNPMSVDQTLQQDESKQNPGAAAPLEQADTQGAGTPQSDQQQSGETAVLNQGEGNGAGAGEGTSDEPKNETASTVPGVVDKGIEDVTTKAPPVAPVPPPPAPAPVVAAAVQAPAVQETSTAGAETGDSVLDTLVKRAEGNTAQTALVNALKNYARDMAKGVPMQPTKGVEHQYALWSVLKGVVEGTSSYDEFRGQWLIVLAFFEHYKNGCLGARYVFRFADNWVRDKEQLAAMQRLINMIMVTSNPEGRQEAAKTKVDVRRTMEEGFTEAARGRMMQFYGL